LTVRESYDRRNHGGFRWTGRINQHGRRDKGVSWRNGNRFSVVTIGARVSTIPRAGTRGRNIRAGVRTVTGSWVRTSPVAASLVGGDIRAAAVDRVDRDMGGDRDRGFV